MGLNGHEFESTPGVGDGQGGLACCSPWGRKDSDTTEWMNWTDSLWVAKGWTWLSDFHFHSLCEFSAERFAHNLLQFPCMLFVIFFLLLLIFFNFCLFDNYVSRHVLPWVYPAWNTVCFLNLVDCFLSCVREVLSYYFLNYLLRFSLHFLAPWYCEHWHL